MWCLCEQFVYRVVNGHVSGSEWAGVVEASAPLPYFLQSEMELYQTYFPNQPNPGFSAPNHPDNSAGSDQTDASHDSDSDSSSRSGSGSGSDSDSSAGYHSKRGGGGQRRSSSDSDSSSDDSSSSDSSRSDGNEPGPIGNSGGRRSILRIVPPSRENITANRPQVGGSVGPRTSSQAGDWDIPVIVAAGRRGSGGSGGGGSGSGRWTPPSRSDDDSDARTGDSSDSDRRSGRPIDIHFMRPPRGRNDRSGRGDSDGDESDEDVTLPSSDKFGGGGMRDGASARFNRSWNKSAKKILPTSSERKEWLARLKSGEFNETVIEHALPAGPATGSGGPPRSFEEDLSEMMGGQILRFGGPPLNRPKREVRKCTVSEALKVLTDYYETKLMDHRSLEADAISNVENMGLVFLDEIDKLTLAHIEGGGDASRRGKLDGVQKELLGLIEGTTIRTKYGPVNTTNVLFVTAGAFHTSKPSDLISELQGRLPIQCALQALSRDDFRRILSETQNNMIQQQIALLGTEGVELDFTPDGITEIATISHALNTTKENIGARRLNAVLAAVVNKISFDAAELVRARSKYSLSLRLLPVPVPVPACSDLLIECRMSNVL